MGYKKRVCYLCGNDDPDTKDHVPPKCFLPQGNFNKQPRITLPAHRKCNNEFSADEEYLRDLVGPASSEYPHGKDILEKVKRSWKRPHGKYRLNKFLKDAKIVQLKTTSGLYLGKALGISFDYERVRRIGIKIARGIIFHDTDKCLSQLDSLTCVLLNTNDVPAEMEKEKSKGKLLWQSLSSEYALHNQFSESVAVRRAYLLTQAEPVVKFTCFMWIGLYAQSFIVVAEGSLENDWKNGPALIAFNRENSNSTET